MVKKMTFCLIICQKTDDIFKIIKTTTPLFPIIQTQSSGII
jgi:hypothetical protein